MRRVLLLAVAAPVAGMAIASAGGATSPESIVGIVSPSDGSGTSLVRLDPRTLKASTRAEIGEYHGTWSLAPGGVRRLAVGLSAPGGGSRIGIRIFDLDSLRVVRDIETGIYGAGLAWVSPRRIVAALGSGSSRIRDPKTGRWRIRALGSEAAVVDPESGKVLHRRSLGASTLDATFAATPRGLVALVPRAGVVRLVLADADGGLRSVTLWRTPVRLRHRARGGSLRERAGLAVDPTGEHAYVFGAGSLVARVDLRTMRVGYHQLTGETDVLDRPAGRGPVRFARWLRDGLVAVYGRDFSLSRPGAETRAGVAVVDVGSWTARTVDARAAYAAFANDRLYVSGSGVRAYELEGDRVFSSLPGTRIEKVLVAGDRAYAIRFDTVRVLDASSGAVLGRPSAGAGLRDLVSG